LHTFDGAGAGFKLRICLTRRREEREELIHPQMAEINTDLIWNSGNQEYLFW